MSANHMNTKHPSSETALANRVLVVTPVGLEGRGGIDRLNRYMVNYLRGSEDGKRLDFVASRGEARDPFWAFHFAGALARFAAKAATGRYGLAHIHVSTNGSSYRKCAFGWIARRFGIPYVVHYHGDFHHVMVAKLPLWARALSNLARGAETAVVLGQPFVEPFVKVLGVDPARVKIVHNGIPDIGMEAVVPRPARDTAHIVFSGEVGLRKGVDILVEGLAVIGPDAPAWRCTIAGNGDLDVWKTRVAEAGLQDKVTFTGWVAIETVHDLMRDADIVVLPSRAEALPLSLIEGTSAGAALVACDTGAVREVVIDGLNGMIVPRDGKALAQTLRTLLDDPVMRARMQSASRSLFLQEFHMQRFVAGMLAVYENARCRRGAVVELHAPAE
ncbi:MAG: glycosyltransferase family 4 protein [Beijerinckiaceae bacterium]